MPTDNIMMFDHFFNLSKKSYRNWQICLRFNTIFDNLAVTYFLGHTVHVLPHHIPPPRFYREISPSRDNYRGYRGFTAFPITVSSSSVRYKRIYTRL